MRCLTLANELRDRGATVEFIMRELRGHLISNVRSAGYRVHRLPAPPESSVNDGRRSDWLGVMQTDDASLTHACMGREPADWLVVDHYAFDAAWERTLRPRSKNILVIDDLADRNHDCDVLLDQGYYGNATNSRYDTRVPSACRVLTGPQYALLHPDYARLRAQLEPRDGTVRLVLVFFGGSDQSNQTGAALEALSGNDLAHLAVDVVIGPNHPDPIAIERSVIRRQRTRLHRDLPSLADIMARADLALGAGGSSTWERCCLGLPSLVVVVAENQRAATEAMHAGSLHIMVAGGRTATASDWRDTVVRVIRRPELLRILSRKSSELVDGLGAKRLARVILGKQGCRLAIRRVRAFDEALLLQWANDAEVRAQSFHQRPISEEEHAVWLARHLENPDSILLIGEDEAQLPLGQVRFDIDRITSEAITDISVDRAFRGWGLSDELLTKALAYLRRVEPRMKPVAEVRDENVPSQRLFARVGFTAASQRRKGAKVFELTC